MNDSKLLDEMIWACANGELPSIECARRCGLTYQQFYKRLRTHKEAYIVFREKTSRRKAPLIADCGRSRFNYDHENDYQRHLLAVMKQYKNKSKLALKELLAKEMGLSFGYYVAFTDGYCRL